jgi:uncharacterized repeat protein (TIGR03806 family)
VAFERAYPQVEAEAGIALAFRPGDDSRAYLATKPGVILTFEDDAAPSTFLDIRDRIAEASEAGLLGVAFHPRFADNGEVFVSYTTPGGGAFTSRIARFVSPDGGLTLDADSEVEVLSLDQPYSNHNGGDIHFGPDGYLYIGFGDGGAGSDPQGNGQNPDTLLGAMLRLDVDGDAPYAIPADNPYATGGGRPEIYATGLRNPWRFSFDRETGDLWVGDVGQNQWEEVDVIERGDNLGWNVTEGEACFGRDTCSNAAFVTPVAQYRNTGSASVIAGAVYRGSAFPELRGAFIYSDHYLGTVWAVRRGQAPQVLHRTGGRRIAAWAQDAAGELLAVDFRGTLQRMVPPPAVEGDDGFPRQLSQTGCVDMLDPRGAADGTIGYDVALPFWSDGADKVRALSVPPQSRLEVDDDGHLLAPADTTLVKTFLRDGVPIETRLLVRHGDSGWAGYAFAWRADGSEADFVPDGLSLGVDAGAWRIPATDDCDFCHTAVAGGSLGLHADQLAIPVPIGADETAGPAPTGDQLDHFVALGLLAARPDATALPGPDAPLKDRARAYLHVNCAQCHQPDGPAGRASLDLRRTTALADTGLCATPRAGDADLTDAQIVTPGDPAASVVLARLRSTEGLRMPPIGSSVVDDDGAALIEQWIAELSACP